MANKNEQSTPVRDPRPVRREEGPTPHHKQHGEQKGTESGDTGRPKR